jgi:transglutaminase-like putative cysteine protease
MRLRIEHTTTYSYVRPVELKRHRLVLRPREGHDQSIVQMHLTLSPTHRIEWIRDVFGNSVALVDFLDRGDQLRIASDVIVDRSLPFPTREMHAPWRVPFPPRYEPLEQPIISVYCASSYPEDSAALQSWLAAGFAADPADAEGSMQSLCKLVSAAVSYTRRPEKGVQSPARTLALGTGSCRDMATLLMDAARASGVAARFVSGYLHGTASIAGRGSTHAWTEVYLPSLGWRGFDPTTGGVPSPGHIVTGVSSHPRGVMPVSGTFVGTAADYRELVVTVKTEVVTSQ